MNHNRLSTTTPRRAAVLPLDDPGANKGKTGEIRGQHWPRTAQHMQRTGKKTIIKTTSKEDLARTDSGLHNRDGQ